MICYYFIARYYAQGNVSQDQYIQVLLISSAAMYLITNIS